VPCFRQCNSVHVRQALIILARVGSVLIWGIDTFLWCLVMGVSDAKGGRWRRRLQRARCVFADDTETDK